MAFFIQALPPALPDCFFNLQNECEKENCFEQQNNTWTAGQQNNSKTASKLENFTKTPDQQSNRQTEETPLLRSANNVEDFADNNEKEEPNHATNEYNHRKEESKLIPVDDSSPVPLSTLFLGFVETASFRVVI